MDRLHQSWVDVSISDAFGLWMAYYRSCRELAWVAYHPRGDVSWTDQTQGRCRRHAKIVRHLHKVNSTRQISESSESK